MADRRISLLSDYTTLTGMYVALDKPGALEAVRAPFILVDPRSVYRANVVTMTAGTTTVVFGVGTSNPFPVGTTYDVIPIWAIADGSVFNLEITNKTINGFDVTSSIDCTFLYVAIILN